MKILSVDPTNPAPALEEAVRALQAGGIVFYPTETTYGVAIDVENPAAVEKLFAYKGKRDGKPISVAVTDQEMAEQYVVLNDTAKNVYKTFLPGPVTVVSTGKGKTAPGIASQDGKVGIRIPKHDLALELIRRFGHGISATGANASNQKRPYAIQDILDHTTKTQQDLVSIALDIGELPHNEPSTVIDTTVDDIVVLRQGRDSFADAKETMTSSVAETIAWFEQFGKRFRSYYTYEPVLYLFSGEMGAGKTHAVKGLARGMGIEIPITSPTYTFANEYAFFHESSTGLFVHIDCWRMKTFEELIDIGLPGYLEQNAVIAIEWSERFAKDLEQLRSKAKLIWIDIKQGSGDEERMIRYSVESTS